MMIEKKKIRADTNELYSILSPLPLCLTPKPYPVEVAPACLEAEMTP